MSDEAVKVQAKVLGLDTSVLVHTAEKFCKKCITGYEKCKAKCEKCFDLQDSYENKLILKSNMFYTPASYCNDFAVSNAELPIFREQLQIENWLFELYDNISGVPKWESLLEKCDDETQYFLIDSYVVIADNSLIFCPHKFPYEQLDEIWAGFLNYILKQFAYSLKIHRVLVADKEYFDKFKCLPTLNKWLKDLFKIRNFIIIEKCVKSSYHFI